MMNSQDPGFEAGLAAEFVRFLNAQLKDTREELDSKNQENAALQQELLTLRTSSTSNHMAADHAEIVNRLKIEVLSLRQELDAAQTLCAAYQAEADTWQTRYEELRPQLARSVAHATQLLDTLRGQLAGISHEHSMGQTAAEFEAFLGGLPGTSTASVTHESRVVFRSSKLPLLSKAAINACIGGVCFFEDLLKWCSPSSQHAYVVFPQLQYNPRPGGDEPAWTPLTKWAALAGQQRELFYVDDDGNTAYAGTFFCHAGPNYVKVTEIESRDADGSLNEALARKTFQPESKTQKTKTHTFVPLLTVLYAEGSATVQMLGLQRVGFNKKLFDILIRALNKRDRVSSSSGIYDARSMGPGMDTEETVASSSGGLVLAGTSKRTLSEEEDDLQVQGDGAQGPSKIARRDEGRISRKAAKRAEIMAEMTALF